MADYLTVLVCENLAHEVRTIIDEQGWEDVTVVVVPALCPGSQRRMEQARQFIAAKAGLSAERIVVGCGGMRAAAGESTDDAAAEHLSMASCFDMVLPVAIGASLVADGGFLLTPGWLRHWQHYVDEWGFDRAMMREFMAESASRLVMLDTGVRPDSRERLQGFAGFVDLPTQVVTVGLDHMRLHLINMVLAWRLKQDEAANDEVLEDTRRKLADYGMSFDLLSRLTGLQSEQEVIDAILWLFTTLFTPKALAYYPLGSENGMSPIHYPDALSTHASADDADDTVLSGASEGSTSLDLEEPYYWLPSGEGFVMRIGPAEAPVGALKIEGSLFPQYMNHYLNLALSLSEVCALAISDARNHERLHATIDRLEEALASVKTLKGLIPICAGCKKIRDDEGFWTQVESYVAKHTSAEFTHGLCPDCLAEYGLTEVDSKISE